MAENDLTGKVGLDTTDFKTAVAGLNREIRVIESGFRASAAALGDWSSDASGLEMRIKALNGEIDLQKTKVEALTGEYQRIAAEKGTTSRAAQDLEIKINKETEALAKMELELGKSETALGEMGGEATETAGDADKLAAAEDGVARSSGGLNGALDTLKTKLGEAGGKFRELGDKVLDVTKKLAVGLIGAATGAAIGIGALVVKSAQTADELVEMSDKTGLSVTQLQELKYIGEQTGTELDTVTTSMARLTKNMFSSKDGTGAAADAFKTLGVEVMDANGNLKDNEDVFYDVLEALGSVTSETERDALAMQIFGKSAQELNPLILEGADGLAEMAGEAANMGAIMSEDSVRGLADLNDQIGSMKASFGGIAGTMAGEIAPAVGKVAKKFQEWIASPAVQEGIKNIAEKIGKIADTVGEVITKLMSGDFAGALGEIFPQSTVDQIMAVATAIGDFINNTLIPFVKEHSEEIKGAILAIAAVLAAAGIVALIASIANPIGLIVTLVGILGAAWAGNWGGIRDKTLEVVNWLKTFISGALKAIKGWWDKHGEEIKAVVTALWEGIKLAFQTAIDAVKRIFNLFTSGTKEDWNKFGADLRAKWIEIWDGIKAKVQELWDFLKKWVPQLGKDVIAWFKAVDWLAIGKTFVEGIWKGITNSYEWLKTKIRQWVGSFLEFVKGLLGIKSPSKEFEAIGTSMTEGMIQGLTSGLSQGFRNFAGLAQMEMSNVAAGLSTDFGVRFGGSAAAPAAASTLSRTVTIYGGVHVHEVNDAETLLETLARLQA